MNVRSIDFAALHLDPQALVWEDAPHVRVKETVCRCGRCGLYQVSHDVLTLFEEGRDAWNRHRVHNGQRTMGIEISSGVRCAAHQNRINPGSKHRMHVADEDGVGHALDLLRPWGVQPSAWFRFWETFLSTRPQAGLGRYLWGVHLDSGVYPGKIVPAGRRWDG